MRTKPEFYCRRCDGDGGWIDYDEESEVFYQCPDCDGTGLLQNKKDKHGSYKTETSKKSNRENPSTSNDGG